MIEIIKYRAAVWYVRDNNLLCCKFIYSNMTNWALSKGELFKLLEYIFFRLGSGLYDERISIQELSHYRGSGIAYPMPNSSIYDTMSI